MKTSDLSDDREWLDAFRRGDKRALERVFRVYAGVVLIVLRRGARSRDGAHLAPGIDDASLVEDLLHDIFLEAFRAEVRARYDGLRSTRTLSRWISKCRPFDHSPKSGRMRARTADTPIDDDSAQFAIEEAEAPDAILLAREEREQVALFKSTLSEDERAFVKARFEEGASQEESARVLSRSRQQIRTTEQKIRERFRAFMQMLAGAPTRIRTGDEGDEQNPST